jgi:hypothetical protein
VSVVGRVLDALNAHDLDAFVACYAQDATIENGYDTVIARGHDELRERYGPMLEQFPDLRVESLSRVAVGEFVVQHEQVLGRGAPEQHVAVYLVLADKVVRERLIG